jgi:uracil DNA glycosylase superfamily protein
MNLRDWGEGRAVYPKTLQVLYESTLQGCTACALGTLAWNRGGWRLTGSGRSSIVVFVAMSPSMDWAGRFKPGHVLFGADTENRGNEGVFLDALLRIGLQRDAVFVTNLVKCAPKKASLPVDEYIAEIQSCTSTILRQEVSALNPKLIIATGGPAREFFKVKTGERRTLDYKGWPFVPVAGIWHPGTYRRRMKRIPDPVGHYSGQILRALGPTLEELLGREGGSTD